MPDVKFCTSCGQLWDMAHVCKENPRTDHRATAIVVRTAIEQWSRDSFSVTLSADDIQELTTAVVGGLIAYEVRA